MIRIRRLYFCGLAIAAMSLVLSPGTSLAATPAPTPQATASPAPSCAIPPGLEGDPQEQALAAKCVAEQAQIQNEKAKLSNNLILAQGSSDGLKQMEKQTGDAITANQNLQEKIMADIQALGVHEAAVSRQKDATKARLKIRRSEFAKYIRGSYKYQPDLMASVFESKGIDDFLNRAAALLSIRNYGNLLLHNIKDEEQKLQDEDNQLQKDRTVAAQKEKALSDAEKELIANEVKDATILASLNSSIQAGQSELAQANTQSAALVAQIVAAQIAREDQLIQAANDAAWSSAQAWMASNNIVSPNSVGHSTTPFIWPVGKGTITQWFGPSDYAAEPPGFGAAHFHAGIDIANASGTSILAADDGVVVAAEDSILNGHEIGYGRHVIIAHQHDPNQPIVLTLYGHLQGYFVKVGDKVVQGQTIALMGSTGNSSGPHLHFEVRVNNTPVDPKTYLPQIAGTSLN
jgi:murein DD-endopeptidase MepM/ murein hydrolase activator NlpD